MSSNIVHQYFKKETEVARIIIKVNPIQLKGVQLTIPKVGPLESVEVELGENILQELAEDGWRESSPLEFNLFYTGLA
jgi:hypothetical protein